MRNLEDLLYPLLTSYKKSPQFIKNVAGGLYSILPEKIVFGNVYNYFRSHIELSDSYSKEDILNYQWSEIEKVLDTAFSSIPFYQSLYAEYGINRNHIQNFNDFEKLPIINKALVRSNIEFMINDKLKKRKLRMNTGGSSGSPLEFFIHKGITRPKERAFLNSFFKSIGYHRKYKTATFRGDTVPGNDLYMYDPIRRNFIFSSYRVTPDNIKRIVFDLNKIGPKYLFGYPSVIYDISRLIEEKNTQQLDLSLKGIILASEKLFDFQIELIEDIFKTKVYSYYGHSERLVLGYKCFKCPNYIIDGLYGYSELVAKNNSSIVSENKLGRIIGTGFHNLVMPLIRYDTNDESCYASTYCDNCQNSNFMVLGDIEGRASDYLVGADGRKISITGIIFGQHLKEFRKISKFQLIQSEPGNVNFNIVSETKLSSKEKLRLKKKIEVASDHTISIEIVYVDDIIKTAGGKFKYLLQNIK